MTDEAIGSGRPSMAGRHDDARGDRTAPRYRPPGWFVVRVINPLVRRLSVASTLDVPRRTNGAPQRVPVNVVELADGRYLVSVRGRTEWVRNLRAAGHCTIDRGGRRNRYRAVEMSTDRCGEVIAAYRARWGKGHVGRLFEQLPDPADHPVFRLDPLDPLAPSTRD